MTHETQGIRWGRALLAAILVEVLLSLVALMAIYVLGLPFETLNAMVPPASFVAAAVVVAWLFRASPRPVANGIATGLASVALYAVLGAAAYLVAPDRANIDQMLSLPYLASHALKIAGGAAGGWWIARRRAGPA